MSDDSAEVVVGRVLRALETAGVPYTYPNSNGRSLASLNARFEMSRAS